MANPNLKRQKVRLSGDDSLSDVALRVFKDVRLAPLFHELNPSLDLEEKLPKDTIISLPTLEEARTFTKSKGFVLGHDPSKHGGTRVRRNWRMHQEGKAYEADEDPEKLALLMKKQSFEPAIIADRFLSMLSPIKLRAFIEKKHEDSAMQSIAKACESKLLQREVLLFLNRLKELLIQTQKAEGRQRLLESIADNPEEAPKLFEQLLVNGRLTDDLIARAIYVVPFFSLASEIATIAGYDRDGLIDAHDDPDLLRAMVSARVDNVPLVSEERLNILGLSAMFNALDNHFSQINAAVSKVEDTLERAPLKALKSIFSGDKVAVPAAWKLIRTLHSPIAETLKNLHAGLREQGLASLINPGDGSSIKRMSAAELVARAALNARILDEHEGVAEQLAPLYAQFFDLMKPSVPDRGQKAQVRGRRRSRFVQEMFSKKEEVGDPTLIAAIVEDILTRAQRSKDSELRGLANSLSTPQRECVLPLATSMTGPLVIMLRGASNGARALLVVCALFDAELSEKITRSTGQESVVQTLKKHAARIISLATSLYATAHESEDS